MNFIFLGPPGCGKGTQADLLAKKLNLRHISSGVLLRAKASQDTPDAKLIKGFLDRGELVPFATIMQLVIDEVQSQSTGFILDGTPRNLQQAVALDEFFASNHIQIDHVVLFELSDTVSTQRLLKRAQLEGRSDDNEETVQTRLGIYHQDTEPVIAHYEKQGKLIRIDAAPSIEDIFSTLLDQIPSR